MSERKRQYDGSARLRRAAERRSAALAVARRHLLEHGYAATSLPAVAAESEVSVEYLHKTFGGKAGLVRTIHHESLLGPGRRPAPERSDELQRSEDLSTILRGFGAFAAEVAPLVAPIELLIREAAAGGDSRMRALWEQVQSERLRRMQENAARLAARGLLPEGVASGVAADVFWTMTSPDLYLHLVAQRGWSAAAYGRFIGRSLAAALAG